MDILGVLDIPSWLLWTLLIFITLYVYYTWHFNDLKAVGIDGPKPWPVIGTLYVVYKHGMRDADIALSKQYGKIFSKFSGRQPSLVIADAKILRKILITDFANFTNHKQLPLRGTLKKSVFDAQGKTWKHIRTHLTPAFSTSKLKHMIAGIEDCAKTMVNHIVDCARSGEAFEAKTISISFSMDAIARTVFSLDLDTLSNPNHVFIQKTRKLFKINPRSPFFIIIRFLPFLVPVMEHVLCIRSSLPTDVEEYFKSFIIELLKERRNSSEKYNDFVQMMLNSEEDLKSADDEVKAELGDSITEDTKKRGLTPEEVVAQCFLLLVGGYETTGSTLGFVLYHLAAHPGVQDRVYKELVQVIGRRDHVTYEDVNRLTYLDMVVCETLRLFPPFPFTDRQALRDVEYEGVKIPAGTAVIYPVRLMQLDPEVYPEPHEFKPERFSPEEKAKRDPLYFAAFGAGPRNCIGMRLAMLEVKMATALTLRSVRLQLADPEQGPLIMEQGVFANVKGGIRLKAVLRNTGMD